MNHIGHFYDSGWGLLGGSKDGNELESRPLSLAQFSNVMKEDHKSELPEVLKGSRTWGHRGKAKVPYSIWSTIVMISFYSKVAWNIWLLFASSNFVCFDSVLTFEWSQFSVLPFRSNKYGKLSNSKETEDSVEYGK